MSTTQLWTEYRETRDVEQRNQIVCSYLHLAQAHAGRICKQLVGHADYDEIESAAYFGLISAVERFDPTRKIKFETFSYHRIQGAVMDWLRLHDRQARTIRKFERQREEVLEALGRDGPISEEDVVQYLGISHDRYIFLESVLHRGREIYLSFLENSESGYEHPVEIDDPNVESPDSTVSTKIFADFVLTGLSHSERIVVMHYHFGGLTLRQIGDKLGLTESRASQLKADAHARIKARLQDRDPSLL